MDVVTQRRDILITLGTLSGLGTVLALLRTWKWFARSGKQIVDLPVGIDRIRPSTRLVSVDDGQMLLLSVRHNRRYSRADRQWRVHVVVGFLQGSDL